MAKKPVLDDLTGQYSTQSLINNNFDKIEAAFDNTLSRDGSTPNQMEADIDLNSNNLLNVNSTHTKNLFINGQSVSIVEPTKSFETVAEFSEAVLFGFNRDDGTVVNAGPVQFQADSSAAIDGLPVGWVPFGNATPVHYGMVEGTTSAIKINNHAALLACVTNHEKTVIPNGYWRFNQGIDFVGLDARTIEGEGRPTLAFQDAGTINGIYWGPSDLSSTAYSKGLTLRNVNIVGPGTNHTTGSGLYLHHSSGSRIGSNVVVQQFHSCYRVVGGQNNKFDGVVGFGRLGTVASNTDGSSIFWIENYTTTGGTIVPSYTCTLSNFFFSGSSSGTSSNTQDVFRVEAGDDFSALNGYANIAARSLVYVRTTSATGTAQVNFNGVYLDANRFSAVGFAPHCVYVDASTSTGLIRRLMFTGATGLSNAANDALVVVAGSNLKRLIFDGAVITGMNGKSANIAGSTGLDGLHIMAEGLNVFGAAATKGGFYVNGAESVAINGTFQNIDDATAALSLTGTISHVRHAINLVDCAGSVVNTSTGLARHPAYEWQDSGVFTPTLLIGGASTGITYSAQSGVWQRIGNLVWINAVVTLTSKGALTGGVRVGNLPFTNTGSNAMLGSVRFNNSTGPITGLSSEVLAGSREARLQYNPTSGSTDLTDISLTNTTSFRISGFYAVA